MKLDSAIRDLQKEKSELETKLKQVNLALTALTKLSPKTPPESPQAKTDNSVINRPAPQATAAKPAPTVQPANKPAGI
jgi:hypothetical protein